MSAAKVPIPLLCLKPVAIGNLFSGLAKRNFNACRAAASYEYQNLEVGA